MRKLDYGNLFVECEIKAISAEVKRFRRKYRNLIDKCYDFNDLMQEGVIAWWKVKTKWKPSSGKIEPYLSVIVRQRLLDILRWSRRSKRDEELFALSFEDLKEKEAV